jgi:hypothetical protein
MTREVLIATAPAWSAGSRPDPATAGPNRSSIAPRPDRPRSWTVPGPGSVLPIGLVAASRRARLSAVALRRRGHLLQLRLIEELPALIRLLTVVHDDRCGRALAHHARDAASRRRLTSRPRHTTSRRAAGRAWPRRLRTGGGPSTERNRRPTRNWCAAGRCAPGRTVRLSRPTRCTRTAWRATRDWSACSNRIAWDDDEVVVRDGVVPLLAEELPRDEVVDVRRQRTVLGVVESDGSGVLLPAEDELQLPLPGGLLPPGRNCSTHPNCSDGHADKKDGQNVPLVVQLGATRGARTGGGALTG